MELFDVRWGATGSDGGESLYIHCGGQGDEVECELGMEYGLGWWSEKKTIVL